MLICIQFGSSKFNAEVIVFARITNASFRARNMFSAEMDRDRASIAINMGCVNGLGSRLSRTHCHDTNTCLFQHEHVCMGLHVGMFLSYESITQVLSNVI